MALKIRLHFRRLIEHCLEGAIDILVGYGKYTLVK